MLRKAKIDKGCIRSDIILDDRGSLTYPRKTADNGRQVYNNKENCIWHVQAASANKWLKFKITYADFEYDQYCGLDKLHIFNGPIPKAGAWRNPVARICGGSDNRKKDRNGTAGPRRSMFHDGTTGLKRYSNPDCPRKKKGKGFRACKQEGWDNWVELGGNNFTFSFESDQSTQMTGFTIEWTTFDSPAPTPPPPDIQKSNCSKSKFVFQQRIIQWVQNTPRMLSHLVWVAGLVSSAKSKSKMRKNMPNNRYFDRVSSSTGPVCVMIFETKTRTWLHAVEVRLAWLSQSKSSFSVIATNRKQCSPTPTNCRASPRSSQWCKEQILPEKGKRYAWVVQRHFGLGVRELLRQQTQP